MFLELLRLGVYSHEQLQASPEYLQKFQLENLKPISPIGLKHVNLKEQAKSISKIFQNDYEEINNDQSEKTLTDFKNAPVIQLHNHSQFSILQSTISIKKLVDATANTVCKL